MASHRVHRALTEVLEILLLNVMEIVFLVLIFLCGVLIWWLRIRVWKRVAAQCLVDGEKCQGERIQGEGSGRGFKVGVVGFLRRDAEDPTQFVKAWLEQDCDDFEFVLVCDATAEATAQIAEQFVRDQRLRITFIPPGSHNLSRHKLANTIGIKGTSADVVLLTDSGVMPASRQTLRLMTAPMADPGMAAVLGYVEHPIGRMRGAGKWWRQFDSIIESAQWIYAALCGKPYRGMRGNIVLRRGIFFLTKGYSSTVRLEDGDDDIYISELGRHGKVAVELAPAARCVADNDPREGKRLYLRQKENRDFTRKWLSKGAFMRQSAASWMQWLLPLLAVGLGIWNLEPGVGNPETGVWNWVVLGIGCLITVGVWLWEIMAYRKLARALGGVRLWWGVVPMLMFRPLRNWIFRVGRRSRRGTHYTYSR